MQFLEAKDKNLADVLSNNRYRIDSFQREYRWQRRHIEALISDLCICFDSFYNDDDTIENYESYGGYYMGPIVLCDDKKSLSIVDGQQRLTSFTLLLVFLHHAQKALNLPDEQVKDIKQFLYVTKGGKTTLVLNVETRNEVIEHLFKSPQEVLELEEKVKDESLHNLIARYEDITKLFPVEFNTAEKLPIFIEWMLDKIIMVEVKAYSMDSAYTIFETMNDRGLSLNPTEILKGFLLWKIEDENKSEEMNSFWKSRIAELKSIVGVDGDLDFFRAWLRAKYAETIRQKQVGSENEDFELIGTQFHSWVKNNPSKVHIKKPEDSYFFIRSDFDFFSNLYIKLFKMRSALHDGFEEMYCSSFYPIADSLTYPLILSPITKIDSAEEINEKVKIMSKFIDIYTAFRVMIGKAITQSTIRYSMYELVKSVRNLNTVELKEKLLIELNRLGIQSDSPLSTFHRMDNWGFYHYFFARLVYHFKKVNEEKLPDFSDLLRSKRQKSLVLYRFILEGETEDGVEPQFWEHYYNSVACFCLVRRYDLDDLYEMELVDRIKWLIQNDCMPAVSADDLSEIKEGYITEFLLNRDGALQEVVPEIWNF
ncbi:MAG: DUF262 domain-containing protein [Fulvivirga sp.]